MSESTFEKLGMAATITIMFAFSALLIAIAYYTFQRGTCI